MPYAVFFDILGTSRIFLNISDEYEFDCPEWENHNYTKTRRNFHRSLQIATEVVPQGLRFIASFSDCAYLIYDDATSLLLATGVAMQNFYQTLVPVRGGIGYGNFGVDRVVHASSIRSISTEASFFGSALVRAHAAEQCGLKGFRVFVDASAGQTLTEKNKEDLAYIDESTMEEGIRAGTAPAIVIQLVGESALSFVTHELSFIGRDHAELYLRAIDMIELIFPPDEYALEHYISSRKAIHHFELLRDNFLSLSS